MGCGIWTNSDFDTYTRATKGMDARDFYSADNLNTQSVFKNNSLSSALNPYNVMRECRDSEEHPKTLPIILALDVTGSMGGAAVKVAQKLGEIMNDLYEDDSIKDIEFCVMGIGDVYCDDAPIQISQFESDTRIAEQLDQIFFEGGGGGNSFESYTAAWYMGIRHCDLDCWKRGEKGIIITLGDEFPNPFLCYSSVWGHGLADVTGDNLQGDVETSAIIEETKEKFDVYHISIDERETNYKYHNKNGKLDEHWTELLGDNYKIANLNNLASTVTDIIKNRNTTTEYFNW